ncbi:HisA/HisF-related TIM barrel protein [Muribaculum intestinale]|uniref:1-(5-phosphoribosyl)-5-[(5-phosphoribosylamino)methylideneamino] imidazole-4-carboxamide isomerase n=1 Tax=Muribaculum intestinale TaxID=1796646 RepID=A0A1B1S8G5_9BACT|nr:1-(5-phosphoribosyl)-5-[(5-phosphoribosylamino)methylideneamino] imidazole-4-carboxamide isomerase [Muribaculum intestinale]GFI67552.1 1-(5-phosphoribosyl)-5-[(5-phosphoribosylamino) methylideneamino] imidazole-4-carboxamide isomerase [Muribaculaceae bacterium]ANU63089.1 1-(5-phosphoribosyl)-5-[(5-phosphoribosylamino)methylideneamino]imidazole-4-carboxamide isomerase [Muribaculum intestinale]ASB38834.1 1-(5-phosphoribosyl)-5-[(5-phosphoribosylamino)methylideneamino] imidazole-4-carboxamide is
MIEIIPAIDIIGGKCVRLTRGEYSTSKVYSDDPVDMAKRFVDAGCRSLHLVDLDGAKSNHIVNHRTLEQVASRTPLTIDFGGGLKSDDDLRIAFESGAAMVTGGSIAVRCPDTFLRWLDTYGPDRIILGADARGGKIAAEGWTATSDRDIVPFIEGYASHGIRRVISTEISVDGTLEGPAVSLYRRILDILPELWLVASGGVGSISDIAMLDAAGVPAVIVGKAIYEGRISLSDISRINLSSC